MTVLISPSEAQDLRDHFASRPDIWWPGSNEAMVRRDTDGEFLVALKLRPFGTMVALTYKSVSLSEQAATDYVNWLLEKFTAYPQRMELLAVIKTSLRHGVDPEPLSVKLAELKGTCFLRKFPREERRVRREEVEETVG